jgi:hypothetical protein
MPEPLNIPFLCLIGAIFGIGGLVPLVFRGPGLVEALRSRRCNWLLLGIGASVSAFLIWLTRSITWSIAPRPWLFWPAQIFFFCVLTVLKTQLVCLLVSSWEASPPRLELRRVVQFFVRSVADVLAILAWCSVVPCALLLSSGYIARAVGISVVITMNVAVIPTVASMVACVWVRAHWRSWWMLYRARRSEIPVFLILRSETKPTTTDTNAYEDPILSSNGIAPRPLRVAGQSYRHDVVRALSSFGAPVTIGELKRDWGSTVAIIEHRFPDKTWEAAVRIVADRATAIIVFPGETPGVTTELSLIRQLDLHRKTIVAMPPILQRERARADAYEVSVESNREAVTNAWQHMKQALTAKGIKLPGFDPGIAYIPNQDLSIAESARLSEAVQDSDDIQGIVMGLRSLLSKIPLGKPYRDVENALSALKDR